MHRNSSARVAIAIIFMNLRTICTSALSPSIGLKNTVGDPIETLPFEGLLRLNKKESQLSSESLNRTKKFLGISSGTYGNNLELGLSFKVPFLNIPLGGGLTGATPYNADESTYYGPSTTYGGAYGGSPSLGFNGSGVILPIILAIGAVVLVPFLINSFVGAQTYPYGRSDDIQELLSNVWAHVETSLQEYNIDMTSCFQKSICQRTNSQSMQTSNSGVPEETTLEKILDFLIKNPSVNSLLGETHIQEAVVAGKHSVTSCIPYANKCPYSWESVYSRLVNFALETNDNQTSGEIFN